MYLQNSPEYKSREEKKRQDDFTRSLAGSVCSEIKDRIMRGWNKHLIKGYISNYSLDGDNISFHEKLIKENKRNDGEMGKRAYTYPGYVKMRSQEQAELFISTIKNYLDADGVKNATIRKEKITVESFDPNSFLKVKRKEYDAYVFYITVTW